MYFWAQFFLKLHKFCIYGDVFYITHMPYNFFTSVIWRQLKFLHNCHTWKADISPHDNFFSTNNISIISDKYQVRHDHQDPQDDLVLGGNGRSESVCQLPQQPTAGRRSEGEEVGDQEADGDAYDDIGGSNHDDNDVGLA